ncbi:MAG: acetate--CoA ligase family protein [Candidatus Pacearchaeota archaeon]
MKQEVLNAYESHKFLGKVIPVPETQFVRKYSEITLKCPLVLKIVSEQAIHKTEIGGIRIVNHQTEISESFNELIAIAKKNKIKLEGILVQEFIEGQQLIIGLKKDITFGHVILLGLGGIFTEILNDVAIRKCPINLQEAQTMLDELQASKLFHNFRNIKLNTEVLKETLVNLSLYTKKHKEIKELDINPFILNDKIGKAVDLRIVLEK